MKKDIRAFTLNELIDEITAMGEPKHRAKQIYLWLDRKYCDDFEKMTDLPRELIKKLKEKFFIQKLKIVKHLVSKDGTEKFLFELSDGIRIESVLIKEKTRRTLCISTQAGCFYKCPFCLSGKYGYTRNLEVSEIAGQLISVNGLYKEHVTNVVFMGMGEPMENYENMVKAIKTLNDSQGINIGARKITVSTCGIIPGIIKLKDIGLQVELSVSLHASNDKLRNELVPANRKYPLEKLMAACKEYFEATERVITFEYIMIKGKNDFFENAKELSKLLKNLEMDITRSSQSGTLERPQVNRDHKAARPKPRSIKVNLIPFNDAGETGFLPPSKDTIEKFRGFLESKGIVVTVRRSKGEDIMAACGQLAGKSEV